MSTSAFFAVKGIDDKWYFGHDGYRYAKPLICFLSTHKNEDDLKKIFNALSLLLKIRHHLMPVADIARCESSEQSGNKFLEEKCSSIMNCLFELENKIQEMIGDELTPEIVPESWCHHVNYIYQYNPDVHELMVLDTENGVKVIHKI